MTDESAPPPPPPPLETTIGKYIARFRYEKPQPREVRVAAQRSDFWWTNSPRYSPSASPASTWASGGVFRFPQEEEDDDELTQEEEEKSKFQEKKDESDVDSVESKWRRRLGVCSSEKGENLTTRTSVEGLQSWSSAEWSSVEEEVVEEEGEDPEEVIARVRKRLGWSATTSTVAATVKLKPLELRLSMDEEEKRRPLELKPPLSPGSYRRRESLDTFGYSLRSVERERFEEVSSVSSAQAKEEEESRLSVAKSEEGMAMHYGSVSSLGESDTQSRRAGSSSLNFTATELHSSSSSVHSRHEAEALAELGEDQIASVDGSCGADVKTKEEDSSPCDCKAEGENEEELQFQSKMQEQSAAEQVEELPLLPTASPARPEPVLEQATSSSNGSSRSHRSSSTSREQGERIPIETAKTLDSLVSLVVHSWENDFFSVSASEEQNPVPLDDMCEVSPAKDQNLSGTGDVCNAASTPAPPSLPAPTRGSGDQDSTKGELHAKTVPSSALLADKPNLSSEKTAQIEKNEDEEEKEDCEVPGEEDDQIAQMLLGRIALLEAALRQIDS